MVVGKKAAKQKKMAKGGGEQEEDDGSTKKAKQFQGTASTVLAQLMLEVEEEAVATSRHDKICSRKRQVTKKAQHRQGRNTFSPVQE